MYIVMNKDDYPPTIFEFRISLHKKIRLLTIFLGGEEYSPLLGKKSGILRRSIFLKKRINTLINTFTESGIFAKTIT